MLSLDEPFDIRTLIYGVKAARQYVTAQAFNGYIMGEVGSSLNATTDEEIEQWIRNTAETVFHVSCTVPMGKNGSGSGAGEGALEVDLRVKGTVGLRVVDASVYVRSFRPLSLRLHSSDELGRQPYIPAVHTMGPTYIIAERTADLIKAADGRYGTN